MSDTKITVKDLSNELGKSTKDLIAELNQLNIPVKAFNSPLTPDAAERVRAHYRNLEEQARAPESAARPDVKIRRRARKAEPEGQEPPAQPAVTPAVTPVAQEPARQEAPAPQAESAPAATAPVEPDASARDEAPKAQAPTAPTEVKAKIITPVSTEASPEAAPVAEPQRGAEGKDAGEAKPARREAPERPKPARHATPDASAMPEGSSAPTLPRRERPQEAEGEGGRPEASTSQVRIISRPSPEAVQRQADARNAEKRDGARPGYRTERGGRDDGHGGQGQRPSGPRSPRPGAARGGFGEMDAPAPLADSRDGQSKKKRAKGRRTVDFQQGGEFDRHGEEENTTRLGARNKGRRKGKDVRLQPQATQPIKAVKRKIRVTEAIRVADMAHQMGLKSNEIIKVLFGLGVMATINQSLDIDTATLVAAEFDYEVEKVGFSEDDYLVPTVEDKPEDLKPRPPVVTIMGHVDHGKTSLLDAIRKSNVTSGEAGGITQHIGAYHVRTKKGEIVFLDTPGHEAFTAMRARGAQVTDLVILVVAADDGVMEQTREAINHSRAAGVPIMVAVNKMDKPGANPDRVLRELAELGLQAESWGGDTVTAMVSAKTREGLDELLELVALQAEILELKANPDKPARGHIVEAKLDKGRGPVATVLIQQGTLHQGDDFVCGVFSGRVRALFNDQGKKVKEAGPSIPVEVQGFDGVPEAGEEFICVNDEKLARRIAEARAVKQRERELARESKVTLETFLSRRADDQETLSLNLVVKADVQGSLEAITEALNKQSTDKVRINVVHGGAGAISESDILLASASQAIIIGFNVRPTAKVKEIAERENVDIRFYNIIYQLIDDIKSAMAGLLAPVQREAYLGQAEVRKTISVPKVGVIAGCQVVDGKITRAAGVRLLRDGVVVYTGKVASLKRFKDDAREVLKGYECGIALENFNDIKENDVIEAFEVVEEAASL